MDYSQFFEGDEEEHVEIPRAVRKLVDERQRYEIFPNGNSQFLTRRAMQELKEGMAADAEASTFEPANQPYSAKKKATIKVPEPNDRYGAGREIVTLRLRAMRGNTLPDLFEGDSISGVYPTYVRKMDKMTLLPDREEFLQKTGFREFRILEVFWGYKSLVHSLVGRQRTASDGSRRVSKMSSSNSDTNAYVVCEVVIK
jgi:hypothetical protein